MKTYIVFGGAGYIGSNVIFHLCDKKCKIIIVDNLVNSFSSTISKLKNSTNNEIIFHELNICDDRLKITLQPYKHFDGVFIFSALKSIPESNQKADLYYQNNVWGVINILNALKGKNISQLIFSSSASLYSSNSEAPFVEDSAVSPSNPYAWTKLLCETYISEWSQNNKIQTFSLRYFNPVGAGMNSKLGDFSKLPSKNLFPILCEAVTNTNRVFIFGNDYPTIDGTCIRDYIHIDCLSNAHLAVLDVSIENFYNTFNIGTGIPTSVYQIIECFEHVNNVKLNTQISPRREGDLPVSFASPRKANKILGWKAQKKIEDMCKSSFDFHKKFKNDQM